MPANHAVSSWTDDRVEALKRLYHRGLSCSQIAKQLGGISRNAVIGKLRRLGELREAAETVLAIGLRVKRPNPKLHVVRHVRPAAPREYSDGHRSADASIIALNMPHWTARQAGSDAPKITGPVAASLNLTLSDPGFQSRNCCKWPTNADDAAEATFCCAPTEALYCPDHAKAAYQVRAPEAVKRDKRNVARLLQRYG